MTGVMDIMDAGAGHLKVTWDADNEEEVAVARKQFDDCVAKGFAAFRVGKLGKRGERIHAFDRNAEAVILSAPIAGG